MLQNLRRVYDLYKMVFLLKQEGESTRLFSLFYFSTLRGLLDELDQDHPLTNEMNVLKKERECLKVQFRA